MVHRLILIILVRPQSAGPYGHVDGYSPYCGDYGSKGDGRSSGKNNLAIKHFTKNSKISNII